jgi:integrase
MGKQAPLDLSPFGKVIIRDDTKNGRPITRINYAAPVGRVDLTHDTIEEANAHLWSEHERRLAGKGRRRPAQTVAEVAGLWYKRRVRKNLARKTLAADRAYLEARIIPDWGSWKVDQIQPLDVQDWVDKVLEGQPHKNARNGEALSEGMVHKYRRCLDQVLTEAIRLGMISESPARVDLVDITVTRAHRYHGAQPVFNPGELTELWHIFDPRYRALIPLGSYGAGARIGEWAGLAITDFNPRTRDLSFSRKVIEVGGRVHVEEWLKGGNPGRVIRLGDELAQILIDHMGRHSRDGWVFPAPGGGVLRPGNFRNRFWKPAVAAIGRPEAKFHWLRHTNVSALREVGIDLETVSKHAGHASVAITSRIYSHQTDAISDRVASAQDQLVGRLDLSPSHLLGAKVGQIIPLDNRNAISEKEKNDV